MERAEAGAMKVVDGVGSSDHEAYRRNSKNYPTFDGVPITPRARPATAPAGFVEEANIIAREPQARPQTQTIDDLTAQGVRSFAGNDVHEPRFHPEEKTSLATPVKYYRPITRPRLVAHRPPITQALHSLETQETQSSQGRRPMTAPGSSTHRWDPYPPWHSRYGKEEEMRTNPELLPSRLVRPVIPPRLSSQHRPETHSRRAAPHPANQPLPEFLRGTLPQTKRQDDHMFDMQGRRAAAYAENQSRRLISPGAALRPRRASQPLSELRDGALAHKKSAKESDDSDKWVRDLEARHGIPVGTPRGLMYEGKRARKYKPDALQLRTSFESPHQRSPRSPGSRPSSQPSIYAKSPAYNETFDLVSGYATAHAIEDISKSMPQVDTQSLRKSRKSEDLRQMRMV
jgi:hypothetical protein